MSLRSHCECPHCLGIFYTNVHRCTRIFGHTPFSCTHILEVWHHRAVPFAYTLLHFSLFFRIYPCAHTCTHTSLLAWAEGNGLGLVHSAEAVEDGHGDAGPAGHGGASSAPGKIQSLWQPPWLLLMSCWALGKGAGQDFPSLQTCPEPGQNPVAREAC